MKKVGLFLNGLLMKSYPNTPESQEQIAKDFSFFVHETGEMHEVRIYEDMQVSSGNWHEKESEKIKVSVKALQTKKNELEYQLNEMMIPNHPIYSQGTLVSKKTAQEMVKRRISGLTYTIELLEKRMTSSH